MTDEAFLDFPFDMFPPKHRDNCAKPERTVNKKMFFRLSSYYHPDKVDSRWGILCEEISMKASARYLKM